VGVGEVAGIGEVVGIGEFDLVRHSAGSSKSVTSTHPSRVKDPPEKTVDSAKLQLTKTTQIFRRVKKDEESCAITPAFTVIVRRPSGVSLPAIK
jgi:hypothetical protein